MRFGPTLALILAAQAAVAKGEPQADARALFYRACLSLERQEMRASDSWAWIEDLCRREADLKVEQFAAADRTGRRGMLVEVCARWYERNVWRLPEPLQADPAARADYVEAVCSLEAAERLDAFGR